MYAQIQFRFIILNINYKISHRYQTINTREDLDAFPLFQGFDGGSIYKPAKELSNSSTKTNQLQSIVMAAPVKQSRMVVYSVVVISMAPISLTTIMPSAYAGTIFFAGSSTVRSSLFCIRASLLRTDQMNYCMQVVECTYAHNTEG
jgi:hypothetical protein